LFVAEGLRQLRRLVRQAELLARKYDAVVTNPPYMGSRYYCHALKSLIVDNYESAKPDLYGAFMLRNIHLSREGGHVAMITIPNWMFLPTFEDLRDEVLNAAPISSLVHNGRGVWGSDFGSCSFALHRGVSEQLAGRFRRLFEKQGSVSSNEVLEQRFHNAESIDALNAQFRRVPRNPVAYWLTDRVRRGAASQ
jgi:hypothetical protein